MVRSLYATEQKRRLECHKKESLQAGIKTNNETYYKKPRTGLQFTTFLLNLKHRILTGDSSSSSPRVPIFCCTSNFQASFVSTLALAHTLVPFPGAFLRANGRLAVRTKKRSFMTLHPLADLEVSVWE